YEWLGIFAPLALIGLIRWLARSQDLPVLEAMCSASAVSGLVFFCVSLIITIPQRLGNFAGLQPMRGLHLIYILLFVFLAGFRAIAERSRLADVVKDSGAVTMFPALAETWRQQVRAQRRWNDFQLSDFPGLQQKFGVDWVVLQRPGVMGLPCSYQHNAVLVC